MSEKTKELTIEVSGKNLEILLDVPAMRRLKRDPYRFDVANVIDDEHPERGALYILEAEPDRAVDVIFEATAHNPDRPPLEEFTKGLRGEHLEKYVELALDAILDFTPSQKRKAVLLALRKTAGDAQEKALDAILSKVEDGSFAQMLEEGIEESKPKRPGQMIAPAKKQKPKNPSKSGSRKPAQSSESGTLDQDSEGPISMESDSETSSG